MASSQFDAESALFERFGTLSYTYVSYPNGPKIESPSTSINYSLAIIYGDGNSVGLGTDAATRYRGIFQVTIRVPVTSATGDAVGLYDAKVSASAIMALFKRGTSIGYPAAAPETYIHCGSPTSVHLGNVTPEWYTIVVRVPFWEDVA